MDQSGQDLFIVTGAAHLQKSENFDLESLLTGTPGNPFPGQNNGANAEKHRNGQAQAVVHNKTLDVARTETAAGLQKAPPVLLELQSGEKSLCWAENDLQEKLCPGRLQPAGYSPGSDGDVQCRESSGCAANSSREVGEECSGAAEVGIGQEGADGVIADTAGRLPQGTGGQAEGRTGEDKGGGSGVGNAQGAGMDTPGQTAEERPNGGASPAPEAGGEELQEEELSPGDSSSCSFGSSLCFSAPSGDEREPGSAAVWAAAGGVVKSQRQLINNSIGPGQEEGRAAPLTYWSLEAASSAPPASAPSPASPPAPSEPDLVIEVSGRRIRAHKAVLAERSDFFRARLSRQFLSLRGLSFEALRLLLDYSYGAGMAARADNAAELIAGAQYLQMPCAVHSAVDSLKGQLELGNCLELLGLAKRQRLPELREAAYRFMSDHYLRVLREPAVYGRLSGAERELILRKRTAQAPARSAAASASSSAAADSTAGQPCLVVADVNEVFERPSPGASRPVSREGSRSQSPEAGGPSPDPSEGSPAPVRWLYRHDPAADQWRRLSPIPGAAADTRGCGLCTLHNYLFVAGGLRGSGPRARPSDRVFSYNPATGDWAELRPMRQARSQLKLVALDGQLYAIGGECLFSVERYDPRSDRWSPAAPLPRGGFAVAHQAAACAGYIYVSGGSLFYRLLRYDPRRDDWQECPCSSSRRRSADMVALGRWLYRFDQERESRAVAVSRYNTVARLWSECGSLLPSASASPSQPFRCALMGRDIYCVNRACVLRFTLAEEDEDRASPGPLQSLELKPCVEGKGLLFPVVLTFPDKSPASLHSKVP
ncbi:kelch repeat and BTB domain-containing protein 11 [Scyliorhinus canicula]|uniref:kelch repeat and BTB domain-containing protein 11 n=1 Tax=Scyliorhinus canicula TaxID=7830 RepID=UPI0018F40EA1|nr:kelch repeat and BTB domain-containing protein 11 [Scyliorhinus canicula]XP_038656343.1 kelch repeat and BTB domain-containing protein 11 [Scyliorhinus canicula]